MTTPAIAQAPTRAQVLRAAWQARPRWVVARALKSVKPMNTDRVVVRGAPRFDPGETLFSVGYFGEIRPRLWQTLWYLVAPHHRVLPRGLVLGDMTENEFESNGHELTRVSRQTAVYAAARLLGLARELDGQGALVTGIEVGGPCDGLLHPGDVIVAVDGTRVRVAAELGRLVHASDAAEVRLEVVRGQGSAGPGHARTLVVPLVRQDGRPASLGLKAATHRVVVDPGVDVDLVDDPESSGPSAGLVSALSVIDVLTPGSLTGGLKVAATGTVDPFGVVGPVSGVGMKAVAAHRAQMDLLLVPRGLRAEAIQSLPRGSKLRVAEVSTLEATINKLVGLGGTRPELPTR